MPPNFCSDCGASVENADASFCQECGAEFKDGPSSDDEEFADDMDENVGDAGAIVTFPSEVDRLSAEDPEVIEPRQSGRFGKAYSAVVVGLCVLVGYLGSFGLWIWAIALMYDHWGSFWAIAGFLTVFLPLVVIVTCFWWGVPQFFLGFLACVCAWWAVGSVERSKGLATLALLVMFISGGGAGYVAWTRSHTITARDLDRLTDDALAIIGVLRASENQDDAETAISATRARATIRKELAGYDSARKDVIANIVGDYLAYERLLQSDIMNAFEKRMNGSQPPRTISPSTRTALEALPPRIRKQLAEDEESLGVLDQMFADVDLDEFRDGWRDRMDHAYKLKAVRYAADYEDMMGRPIPNL